MKWQKTNFGTQKPPPVCKKSPKGKILSPPPGPCPASQYVVFYDFLLEADPDRYVGATGNFLAEGDPPTGPWFGSASGDDWDLAVDFSVDEVSGIVTMVYSHRAGSFNYDGSQGDLGPLCPAPYDSGILIEFTGPEGQYQFFRITDVGV